MDQIRELDGIHQIQWPIMKSWVLRIGSPSRGKSDRLEKLARIYLNTIYRQPTLVTSLSFLMVSLFLLFPDQINQSIPFGLAIAGMFTVLVLMFFELGYLFLRRLLLGFADNFREDFERQPVEFYAQEKYKWSTSEFIYKNVLSIVCFLVSSIIGFYALFFGIYRMNEQSFLFDVCTNRIHYMVQLAYFTIVTFATVGFGDIKPSSALAQTAVSLEILYAIGIMVLFLFMLSNTLSEK